MGSSPLELSKSPVGPLAESARCGPAVSSKRQGGDVGALGAATGGWLCQTVPTLSARYRAARCHNSSLQAMVGKGALPCLEMSMGRLRNSQACDSLAQPYQPQAQ